MLLTHLLQSSKKRRFSLAHFTCCQKSPSRKNKKKNQTWESCDSSYFVSFTCVDDTVAEPVSTISRKCFIGLRISFARMVAKIWHRGIGQKKSFVLMCFAEAQLDCAAVMVVTRQCIKLLLVTRRKRALISKYHDSSGFGDFRKGVNNCRLATFIYGFPNLFTIEMTSLQ